MRNTHSRVGNKAINGREDVPEGERKWGSGTAGVSKVNMTRDDIGEL